MMLLEHSINTKAKGNATIKEYIAENDLDEELRTTNSPVFGSLIWMIYHLQIDLDETSYRDYCNNR